MIKKKKVQGLLYLIGWKQQKNNKKPRENWFEIISI